ncbi:MAG: alginate lyase family protein, partial [Planctomycetes bacterium]|nr:alginate lyase family protein [Planctomycetota bacterium]
MNMAPDEAAKSGIKDSDKQNVAYPTTVVDLANLARVRGVLEGEGKLRAARDELFRAAEGMLENPIVTVMDKELVAPSGDKHDYMSFGPYWWPDPSSPDGLPYIRRDGEVNPEALGPGSDRVAMEALGMNTEMLALAWYFSGDGRFSARALEWLRAWLLDEATRMSPHLEYG